MGHLGELAPMTVLLALALLTVATARTTDDSQHSKQKYFWKTGSWGACVAEPALCGEGRRERPVWCSEPDGRTVLQFQCDPATEPPAHKPCFVACRHHKDKLQWQVGSWGPCLPAVPDGDGSGGGGSAGESGAGTEGNGIGGMTASDSGQGVMQRNVSCILSGATGRPSRIVDEENCMTAARKPDAARLCHIPRPQDCVVGPFSAWSTCPVGCGGDSEDDGGPGRPANQTRVRSVLVAPLHGGRECPPLSEWRPCRPRPRTCPAIPPPLPPEFAPPPSAGTQPAPVPGPPLYRLKLGEWRRCQPPSAVVAADSYAHGSNFIHEKTREAIQPVLSSGRDILLPTVVRTSGALGLNLGSGVPGSSGLEVAAIVAPQPPQPPGASPSGGPSPGADPASPAVAPASVGLPSPGSVGFSPHPSGSGNGAATSAEAADAYYTFQSQVGLQMREVSCRDSHGAAVQLSLCLGEATGTALPARVRPCVVPQDCVVSQWSAWARTQDGCVASGGRARPEIQTRKREVVKLPEGDGRQCPHLLETRRSADRDALPPCAHKYRWLASKWSPCVVTSDEAPAPGSGSGGSGAGGGHTLEVGCGGGVQLRDVTCVAAGSGRPVNPELCASLQPLPTVQRCEVACPRDCEVGEWGEWGPCRPLDCPHTGEPPAEGYRERRRAVLVQPSENGVPCPAVTEVQPCPQPACHRWVEGSWGPCELRQGVKHCGEGRRSRTVTCRTLYGSPADESACLRLRPRPDSEEPCLLPCPYDCVLSPWSEWSPCSHACSSPRHAALRQRNRTVVAPPGPGGHPCPDPDEMLQMEPCNVHSCHGFSWLALPWQPCRAPPQPSLANGELDGPLPAIIGPPGAETEDTSLMGPRTTNFTGDPPTDCGRGIQEREVWCMEANNKHVDDWRCQPLPKPETSRACTRPCPVDCQMSPWSEWSPCPQHCVPDASGEARDGEVTPTQARARVALRWPRHGGSSCPPTEELRPCPLSGARCRRYAWGTGPWSECRLPAQLKCGIGYRTRPVWCYRNHQSSKVEPSLCYEHNGTAPSQSEPCHVDCELPCVLSAWGPWSACRHACSARTRSRSLLGLSAARDACRNATRFPLAQAASCPCDRYTLASEGEWSECVLERPLAITANGRPAPGACGAGTRTRRAACRDKTGALVEPSLCGVPSGLQEEPCLVPCPSDCLLSEWTPWGACSALCGPGVQNRTRRVLREPANSGRPCGDLQESKLCHEPCDHFKWVAAGWGDCQLIGTDRARGCGTGDQYRRVRCMRFRPHALPEEVADPYCDPVTQPADVNACHVACPGDCVLSPWSDWSECSKPCEPSRERQRTRSVLRGPASDGERCPPLIEVQACRLNSTCFTYAWRATDFSSCLPLGGSPCGEGVKARAVYCRRSDGRPVADSLCAEQDRPTETEKWCYVDCPVDCEVTTWEAWNASKCRCGDAGGQQTRRRHMLTPSSPRGRPCPLPLVQTRPCPARPCYAWDVGSWGACDLHGAWCGHGTVRREVRCLRDGVTTVELRLCRREQRRRGALAAAWDDGSGSFIGGGGWDDAGFALATSSFTPPPRPEELRAQDSCYVPCRGDCHVSEWSHWSHCHRDCRGPDIGGYQTRSRAVLKAPAPGGEPCPTALWETRPCFSGPCLSFDWALAADGSLVCRRSDGVIVIGGCDGRPRPCSARVQCEAPGARCDASTGRCACPTGSVARTEAGRLVACDSSSSPAGAPSRGASGGGADGGAAPGGRRRGETDAGERAGTRLDLGGMRHRRPHEDTAEIQSRFYYPKDDDINVWMFAMIGIGCVFIIFVAVSLYIMWKSNDEDGRYLFVQQDSQQKVL